MTTVSALVGAAVLISFAAPALAAGASEERSVKVAEITRVETSTSAASETEGDGYACNRARRRLWVAGEGWVVRRVTTCR